LSDSLAGRLVRLVPLWLMVAIPLAVLKPGNDYVMQPKVVAAMAGAVILVAGLATSGGWVGAVNQPIVLPLLGLLAATALSVPAAVNLPQAVRLLVEQAGWCALALGAALVPVTLDRVLSVSAAVVGVMLWIALDQLGGRWYVGHGDQFGPGRIYATLGNPSFFGVYLAPVAVWFVVGIAAAARAGRVIRATLYGAALGSALFLMYKAAVIDAWAGLACGAAAAVWLALAVRYRGRIGRPTLYAGLVFAAGALAATWVLVPYVHDRLDYLKVKAFSWHAAAWLWRDHPVFGAGPGGFQAGAPQIMTRVYALWTGAWGVSRSLVSPHDEAFAHQDYLQMLAETGVVGAGLWCLVVAAAVRMAWNSLATSRRDRVDRIAWVAGLMAFLPTMALHFPLHLAPASLIFWLSIGWAGRTASDAGTPETPKVGTQLGWAVAALLVCVILVRGLTCNVLLGEGYRYFRGGAPRQAAGFFERFERLSSNDFEERFYAGAMYQALHDESRAIASYERALALYPGMQGALYNLGNVYFNRGTYDQAAEIYRRVLEINPDTPDALNNLGNCYGLLGRPAEAERYYLQAVALEPTHADALYNLAVNATRMKHAADARRWLRQTLRVQPGYGPARELARSMGMAVPPKPASGVTP
jgi:Tfp pilus assembly protein PilF/O-antigen ligase